ncbi:hypothetical protein FOL46_005478, partial [Perkinsus olseni]
WLLRDRGRGEEESGYGLGRVISISGQCSSIALSTDCLAIALEEGVIDLYTVRDPHNTIQLVHSCRVTASNLLTTAEELPPRLPVDGLSWASDRVLLVSTAAGLGAVSTDGARLGCYTHGCGPVKFAA